MTNSTTNGFLQLKQKCGPIITTQTSVLDSGDSLERETYNLQISKEMLTTNK